MKKTWILAMAAALAGTAWAQQEPDMAAMMQALTGAAQAQQGASSAAMVSPKALKDALPKELPGVERVEAGSEKQSAFGVSTVTATGVYENGEKSIRIELTDMGGMGGLGAMAMMGLVNNEVDKETRTGFERTATYQGFKVLESYDKAEKSGQVEAFIGSRFSVKITGAGLGSFDEMTAAVQALDLKALSGLKPETAP